MNERVRATLRLWTLSTRLLAGRRAWLTPVLTLAWPLFQVIALLAGWNDDAWETVEVQNGLIAFPLALYAIGLGVRVIAGEVERRTLEVGYTVPGGIRRLWLAKLAGACGLIVAAELLLAAFAHVFLAAVPWQAFYGALQPAFFFLAAGMAWGALFRSEVTGAMASVATLWVSGMIGGFGESQVRLSPFWNTLALEGADRADVLAWTVQNRVGFVFATAAVVALGFARAERREKMLGG